MICLVRSKEVHTTLRDSHPNQKVVQNQSKSGRDPSLTATVCEQRWYQVQELIFDALRVTTIDFSEVEQPTQQLAECRYG